MQLRGVVKCPKCGSVYHRALYDFDYISCTKIGCGQDFIKCTGQPWPRNSEPVELAATDAQMVGAEPPRTILEEPVQDSWKDITSYRQGDNVRRPTVFELRLGKNFRTTLCYSHIDYPNEWVCTFCGAFEQAQLKLKEYDDLPKAKLAALKLARQVLAPALALIDKESAVTVAQHG